MLECVFKVDGAWESKTRGLKDICTRFLSGLPYDAYGALEYLSTLPIVDSERVVLMEFSMGGITALVAVQRGAASVATLMARKFKAAVAFYPPCGSSDGNMSVPALILIGELDDWTPAEDYHAFVSEELQPGMKVFGHWIEYNQAAASGSVEEVSAFLRRNLHD